MQILNEHQVTFIRIGVYLVLEQLKSIAYRSLFKRIALITENTRISLNSCAVALSWLGKEMDLDEIECVLANLIFHNKVKGYISHQKRVLVVSKTDPFPTQSIVKKLRKS